MIDSNELRIDNLVYYMNNIVTVKGIKEERISCRVSGGDVVFDDCSDFEPIQLTEDWVKDAGFVMEWKTYKREGFELSFYSNKWMISYGGVFIKYIKYVHELQNLFFFLKSKELDFKTEA